MYNTVISVLVDKAKNELGIDYTRSTALLELIYSTGVQFHSDSLGISALGNVHAGMSDEEIINASYEKKIANYQTYFQSSSTAVQESIKNRFINEWSDALDLLNK